MAAKTKRTKKDGGRRIGFQVQLNQNEVSLIDSAAIKAGMKRGSFMRWASLKEATRS